MNLPDRQAGVSALRITGCRLQATGYHPGRRPGNMVMGVRYGDGESQAQWGEEEKTGMVSPDFRI